MSTPSHGPAHGNPFDRQTAIPGVNKIIAVSSGKGGVGKSTVAANLAVALAHLSNTKSGENNKVGLLDADIYGPSVPRLFGALHQRPHISADQKIEPVVRLGIKLMSIGFLVEEGAAVVWRGPMLFKAMDQFFRDVNWAPLDYLVIDLPPGTGDVQLSVAQKVPVSGAIAVSTPQNLALIDVKKAIDMWKRVNVPVLGVVENMSYMLHPATQEKIQLFPKGELESYLVSSQLKKLGEVSFDPSVGLSSEAGIPIVESHPRGRESEAFFAIAKQIVSQIG
jgi:ATP-binding protein involved in chromosome partitioning